MNKKKYRPSASKATLKSRWWKQILQNILHCSACGGKLQFRFLETENTKRHICLVCEKVTYINPRVVAGVIPVLPDGRVVLLRRNLEPGYGLWTYPAGYMELGETIEQAARRETQEEICVELQSLKFLGLYSYEDAAVITVVYEGRVKVGHKPGLSPEALEVKAFSRANIPWKKLAFRSVIDAMEQWNCQPRA